MNLRTPKYICPHCNQPGLSTLRRAYLGAASPATCTSCGKRINISYRHSLFAATPLMISVMLAPWFTHRPMLLALLLALGAGAMFVLFYKWVPLRKS